MTDLSDESGVMDDILDAIEDVSDSDLFDSFSSAGDLPLPGAQQSGSRPASAASSGPAAAGSRSASSRALDSRASSRRSAAGSEEPSQFSASQGDGFGGGYDAYPPPSSSRPSSRASSRPTSQPNSSRQTSRGASRGSSRPVSREDQVSRDRRRHRPLL